MKKYIYAILIGLIAFPILVQAEMPAEKYEALMLINNKKASENNNVVQQNSSQSHPNKPIADIKQLGESISCIMAGQAKQEVKGYMVILFTTTNCSHCATAKDNMKKKGSDGTSFESRLKAEEIHIYEISTQDKQYDLYKFYFNKVGFPKLLLLKDGVPIKAVNPANGESYLLVLEKLIK